MINLEKVEWDHEFLCKKGELGGCFYEVPNYNKLLTRKSS